MSTTEAQVIARALRDSLVEGTLKALRAAEAKADGGAASEERLVEALPSGTAPEVKNLVLLLAREGKLAQLPEVIGAFERYARGDQPKTPGAVVSAVELDAAQQQRIISELQKTYGDDLDVRFEVDPSLIGGLIIRVGDQVLDNSLRTRLSVVQRNMLAS